MPYLEVLARLQDDVPPDPFVEVRPIIENELKIENIFETFDTSALSGASLGQVYLAKYNGNEVIATHSLQYRLFKTLHITSARLSVITLL